MIELLIYILVYPLIIVISILPFRVLYFFSDVLFFILYYIIGYRKKVILENLQIAFPNKSIDELKIIRKKSYHHFVDILLETVKTFTISKKEILKRFSFTNQQEFIDFIKANPDTVIMSSHYANYEWLISVTLFVDSPAFVAYKPVKNKYINKFIKSSREKFGSTLVPSKFYIRNSIHNYKNNHHGMYTLLSDQSPKLSKVHHFSPFFNEMVPSFTGSETLAKKNNYPVLYLKTKKIKRGYYESTMQVLQSSTQNIPDFEITDLYMKTLEEQIKEKPEYYFWTHKRFKHMKTLS